MEKEIDRLEEAIESLNHAMDALPGKYTKEFDVICDIWNEIKLILEPLLEQQAKEDTKEREQEEREYMRSVI